MKKTITLFEAFSGIGSQYQALKNIAKIKNWNVKVVGNIEWFIPAIIAYQAIHYPKCLNHIKKENFNDDINLSNDSKRPISTNYWLKIKNNSIIAYFLNLSLKNSTNFFDIKSVNGGGI